MTPSNAAPLVARGADMVAAISSAYDAQPIDAAVLEFTRLFTQ
jgi:thiamine-phosphate pyrophosphorylase